MNTSEDVDDVTDVLNYFAKVTSEEPKYGEIEKEKSEDSGDYFLEYDKVLAYERYEPSFEDTLVNHYILAMSGFFMKKYEAKEIMAVYTVSEDSTCSRSSSEISVWSDDSRGMTGSSSSGMGSEASSVLLFKCWDKSRLLRWRLPIRDQMARLHFKSGSRYVGRLSLGLMEGKGTYYWPDGAYYKGKFEGSNIIGWGTLRWPNGDWYEGQMYANLRHGRGTMAIDAVNSFYRGNWSMGRKHGQGMMVYGTRKGWYSGNWLNGIREGYGIRFYSKGCVYIGDWKNNNQNGLGIMLWKNRDMYNGEWKDGAMEGVGSYVWEAYENRHFVALQHNWYYGEWRNGQRHGYGVLMLSSGAIIRGEWRCGLKSGWAEVVCTDGSLVVAHDLFLDDVLTPGAHRIPVSTLPQHDILLFPQKSKRKDVDLLLEEKWLRAVISRRMQLLRRLYDTYSTLMAKYDPQNTPDRKPAMLRLLLWTCLRDCGLYETGMNLVEMDADMGYSSRPFDYVPMFEMVHYLLALSWELYGKRGRGSSRVPGYLGATFDLFIRERVKYALSYPSGTNTLQPGCGMPPGMNFDTFWPTKGGENSGETLPGEEYLNPEKYLDEESADLLLLGLIGSRRLAAEAIRACPPIKCAQTGILNNRCQFIDMIAGCVHSYKKLETAYKTAEARVAKGEGMGVTLDEIERLPSEKRFDSLSSTPTLGSECAPSIAPSDVSSAESPPTLAGTSPPGTMSLLSEFTSSSLSPTHDSSSSLESPPSLPSPPFKSSSSCPSVHSPPSYVNITLCDSNNLSSASNGSEGGPSLSDDELKIKLADIEGDLSDKEGSSYRTSSDIVLSHLYSFTSASTCSTPSYSSTSSHPDGDFEPCTDDESPSQYTDECSYSSSEIPIVGPKTPPPTPSGDEYNSLLPASCSLTSLLSYLPSDSSTDQESIPEITPATSDYESSAKSPTPMMPSSDMSTNSVCSIQAIKENSPVVKPVTEVLHAPEEDDSFGCTQPIATTSCCQQESIPSSGPHCRKHSFDTILFDSASSNPPYTPQPIRSLSLGSYRSEVLPKSSKLIASRETSPQDDPKQLFIARPSSSTLSSSSTASSPLQSPPSTDRYLESATNPQTNHNEEEYIPLDIFYGSSSESESSYFFSSTPQSPQSSLSGRSSSACVDSETESDL
ncbi:hypothetical protein AAG570_002326 [Ranatra chinensis]|uniref:Uncharacterized protein n=1 Tax=Ranatra chinensis TaxID=642074 RepID=A0ABD0YVL4_9HEMI